MIRWLIDQKRPARPAAITPSDCPRDIETALNDLLRPRPGNSEFLHCYLFRYLAAARPLENESDMSREQWIRSAADLYDGVQRRLWYFRSLLDDKPTDVYPFEKLSEKERVDRFIEVLKAEDLNPRYSAIRQKRPMAFDKHPGLPADWPDIALVMIYLDIKEIWQTMDDWRVKQRRPNSLKRLVGS
jgi:hypothetical protein